MCVYIYNVIMRLKDKIYPYSFCVVLKGVFYAFLYHDSFKALAKHNKCVLKPFTNFCSWSGKKSLLKLTVSLL